MRLEDGRLTVSMKTHCATEQEARGLVEPLLRAWELDQALQRGRRELRFEFGTANIVDRNPPAPGSSQVIRPRAGECIITGEAVTLIRGESRYPPPPAGFVASADVDTLWHRYDGSVQGREPLASMAYACFTFVTKNMAQGETHASKKLNISGKVHDELGRLASRKGEGKYPSEGPYSAQEEGWVAAAIRLLIRRVGEEAAGVTSLQQITMADLPKLDG